MIRRYLPKGTDLSLASSTRLRFIEDRLDNRPRRVLDRKTPNESYQDTLRQIDAPARRIQGHATATQRHGLKMHRGLVPSHRTRNTLLSLTEHGTMTTLFKRHRMRRKPRQRYADHFLNPGLHGRLHERLGSRVLLNLNILAVAMLVTHDHSPT